MSGDYLSTSVLASGPEGLLSSADMPRVSAEAQCQDPATFFDKVFTRAVLHFMSDPAMVQTYYPVKKSRGSLNSMRHESRSQLTPA